MRRITLQKGYGMVKLPKAFGSSGEAILRSRGWVSTNFLYLVGSL